MATCIHHIENEGDFKQLCEQLRLRLLDWVQEGEALVTHAFCRTTREVVRHEVYLAS